MKKFTKFLLLVMAILFSSSFIIAQVNPAISVFKPNTETTQQSQDLTLQEEQDIMAEHGPTVVVPLAEEGSSRAVGDNCSSPIIINLPAQLPYQDLNQYNCGRLNDYANTACLGVYDGGEDILYQFNVTSSVIISIALDTKGTTYPGMAVMPTCGDATSCIAYKTNGSAGPLTLTNVSLAAGTYFFMVDTWPSPNCIPNFDLFIYDAAPNYTPVTAFPLVAGFESGTMPAQIHPVIEARAHTSISSAAAATGSKGLRMTGGDISTGYTLYTNGVTIFTNNVTHIAKNQIQVVPSGQTGALSLKFKLKMTYAFSNANYSWFRVTVNGTAIADVNGLIFPRPATANADPFVEFNYDLTPYQGSTFILALESCGRYGNNYSTTYSWGDCSYIDDLEVYYNLPPGNLQGYVLNYYGVPVGNATVAHQNGASTLSNPDGSYFLPNIPYGDQVFTCTKSGYNTATATINIPSGGTANYNWALTQPNMVIQPLIVEETLNPNEYFTFSMSVLNNGTGPLDWVAEIVYPETDMPVVPVNNFDLVEYLSGIPAVEINTNTDPSGLAPVVNPNSLPEFPATDLRDFDSQAWAYKAYPNEGFITFILNAPGTTTTYGGPLSGGDFMTGSDFVGEVLYGTNYYGQQFFTIDPATGAVTVLGGLSAQLHGLAYDYTNETMYGIGGGNNLYTVNLANGALTLIGNVPVPGGGTLIDLACDNDGNLISVPVAFSGATPLGLINKTNGAWTTLANPPFTALYAQGMSCDHTTNTIYWASYSSGGVGALYIVDQTNGACTLVGAFPGNAEVDGLAIPGGAGVGSWLTMDYYEGTAEPFGGVNSIPTHMDATGTEAGQVYTAQIVFTSDPDVSTITVPVTMIIAGNPLNPPDDLVVTLVNDITGQVNISWTWSADAFQYFLIKRDGVVIGTTTLLHFTDMLPDYGTYCYTVQAVYDEGQTAPAGPECIDWAFPDILVDPNDLYAEVWEGGYEEDVHTTIYNNGDGTLAFSFPLFAAMDLLNDPNIEKNQPGAPYAERSGDEAKGENTNAGNGYPIVLGAGGPDSFGYMWIDSDEPGGPGFSWIDISGTGTLITNPSDDGIVGPFPMGFGFNFYGVTKTQYWISGNGAINFNGTALTLGNTTIPTNSTTYNDFIAWFWDDMGPHYAGVQIYRQSFADYTIVQYNNMCRYGYSSYNMDVEVIMYASGKIKIQYKDITSGFPLNGGTIGIQSSTPSVGLQVSNNAVYIHNNLALQFSLPGQFIVDVQPAFGTIAPNSSLPVDITYSSLSRTGILYDPGTYTEELELESNDQDTPTWIIFNTMLVYTPATIAGLVTDCNDDEPLNGVIVSAGAFQTATDGDGLYSLVVDPGGYNMLFEKIGYETVSITGSPLVLYGDDFESYAVGNYIGLVNPTWWTTWSNVPGTGEDGIISDTYANSPTKSVRCDEADGQTDLIFKLGDQTFGVFDVNWDIYVPAGYNGYYNFQHFEAPGIEWAVEVYFNANGTGRVDAGGSNAAAFNYSQNTWISCEHHIDLDNDWAQLFINGNLVHAWQWSLESQGGTGTKQLGGVDFYAGVVAGSNNDLYYIDDVEFSQQQPGVYAPAGEVTVVNVCMWDASYAPSFVHAEVMDLDTWCEVTWGLPAGPYEISFDDGTFEDLVLWQSAGSQNAVKFTPIAYPAEVIGGRLHVGDGDFPGPFLGTEFSILVLDDDGPNGLPGTVVDSIGVTVNNYGWVSFGGLSAEFTSGNFYISMLQTSNAPNAAPLGVDTELPTFYRSYSKFGEGIWATSVYQDFMIRAYVNGSTTAASQPAEGGRVVMQKINWADYLLSASGTIPRTPSGFEKTGNYRPVEGMSNRDVVNYIVARFSDFDPNGSPLDGNETVLVTTTNLIHSDYAWAGLDQGWYAYGVKAYYTSGEYSEYAISNIVGHLMDFTVTINVTLSTGEEPSGVQVSMTPFEYPYQSYAAVTPTTGTVEFEPVWKGKYTVRAAKLGFDTYIVDYTINSDKVIDIVLGEVKYAPSNLYVDPLTLIATWNAPFISVLNKQDFEDPTFPPDGWTIIQNDYNGGWERTDGYSGSWNCPAGDGFFALANDDGYISHNGRMDYLITPEMNLQAAEGFALTFDYFFDGYWGGSAYLEYSVDGGSTWEQILEFPPVSGWSQMEVDLSDFSGAGGMDQFWIAFHYDDNGYWADGLAVDNVQISVPDVAANFIDFYLFLDNAFHGTSVVTTYDYAPLDYGVTYTASVAARYTSGLSAKSYYTFTSVYLLPPTNLTGTAPDDAAILLWEAPVLPDMPAISAPVFTGTLPVSDRAVSLMPDPSPEQVSGDVDLKTFLGTRGSYAYAQDLLGNSLLKYDVTAFTYVIFGSASQAFFGGDFGKTDTTTFYAIDYNSNMLYAINKATGAVTPIGGSSPLFSGGSFTGMACDKATGVMYICYTDITRSQIGTVDLVTGAKTAIGSTTTVSPGAIEIAIDGTGQMYSWDIVNDASYTVDKVTGVFTLLGSLGTDLNYAQGGNWDPVTDQIYMAAYSGGGQLRVLDRTTGASAYLASLPSELDMFAFPGGSGGGGGGGGIPENLLGYNVYRENEFISYVAHPTVSYVDEGLEPGEYCYAVTAVYDLTVYGFPGETGESMEEGPECVEVNYCFDLEFMEDWNLGNFADNQWQTGTDNWFINGQLGNPAPAAEFTWDPIMTDYSSTLTSYPLCASEMTEGKLWLDYDVKLGSVNNTGEETLLVQIWNWDSDTWSTIATYTNADGSFGWMTDHKNITSNAMNKVFKIRFNATGANTLDILNWFVDNIHVYRVCDAPTELTSTLIVPDLTDVELTWTSPGGGGIDEWIHWDDGVNADAIGANAAIEFEVAARWTPEELAGYAGASVTQITFYPYEVAATYRVRVWTGVSGTGPANMVADQAVTSPVIDSWNTITLTTPVAIDVTQDLWIGYYIDATTGWPAGCDDGPAIDGSGNMINWGGWQTLLELAPTFDYNWNIQGYVQSVAGVQMPLSMDAQTYSVPTGITVEANDNYTPANPVFMGTNGSRALTGFNIWRNFDGGTYEIIGTTTETTYVDPDVAPNGLYCYMVQAVYTSGTDQCESALSNETCEVLTVSITDPNATTGSFSMYPNPADDQVFIVTSGDLKRVTVYNALGQLIVDEITTGKQYELKTAGYTIGVYMVRVETAAGVTTRTLTIQR